MSTNIKIPKIIILGVPYSLNLRIVLSMIVNTKIKPIAPITPPNFQKIIYWGNLAISFWVRKKSKTI
jgi:hypothetical protein